MSINLEATELRLANSGAAYKLSFKFVKNFAALASNVPVLELEEFE